MNLKLMKTAITIIVIIIKWKKQYWALKKNQNSKSRFLYLLLIYFIY